MRPEAADRTWLASFQFSVVHSLDRVVNFPLALEDNAFVCLLPATHLRSWGSWCYSVTGYLSFLSGMPWLSFVIEMMVQAGLCQLVNFLLFSSFLSHLFFMVMLRHGCWDSMLISFPLLSLFLFYFLGKFSLLFLRTVNSFAVCFLFLTVVWMLLNPNLSKNIFIMWNTQNLTLTLNLLT